MGLFNIFGKQKDQRSQEWSAPFSPTDDFWYQIPGLLGSGTITQNKAQQIAAVYACQTAIAESIAMLPVMIFNQVDDNTTKVNKEHPLFNLLRHAPNGFQDSFEFFETHQYHLLDNGNAFIWIQRKRSGAITALIPFDPSKMKVEISDKYVPVYRYSDKGVEKVYSPSEVLHVKYRSYDGVIGRSPLQCAGETFKFSKSLQEHGVHTFENGAAFSGFLKTVHKMRDDEQRENLITSFANSLGLAKWGKFGILEQGLEFQPVSQKLAEAQYQELRKFSVLDIARIYRMPPHMIQDLEAGASYASIEQQSIAFVQYTIQPWVTRWERAIKRQLLGISEDDPYVKFNISALIRGDLKSRTEAIVQQLQYGLKTINEARNLLDENPVNEPAADMPMVSHNLVPLNQILDREPTPNGAPEEGGANKEPSKEDDQEEGRAEQFLPLFRSLMSRLVNKELNALQGAKPEKVRDFYRNHQKIVRDTLLPAVVAFDPEAVPVFYSWEEGYIGKRISEWEAQPGSDDHLEEAAKLLTALTKKQ